MKEDKVSIVVPVYNCEAYVERCIQSILNQTYQNIEVLIVDDGSKDCSVEICKQYVRKDSRIKFFSAQHIGVATARNFALKQATGTYLQFIDSDDYMKEDATEMLIEQIQGYDLAVCGYYRVMKEATLPNPHLEAEGSYLAKEYLVNTLKDPGHHYYGVNWNKMYRMDMIRKHEICFNQKVTLGEDFIFNLEYLKYCEQVKVFHTPMYYYNCVHQDSLSREEEKTITSCEEELNNRIQIYHFYEECFEYFHIKEMYEKEMQLYWVMFYIRQTFHLRFEFGKWTKEERRKWRNTIQSQPLIVDSLKNNHSRYLGIKINSYVKMEIKRMIKRCIGLVKKKSVPYELGNQYSIRSAIYEKNRNIIYFIFCIYSVCLWKECAKSADRYRGCRKYRSGKGYRRERRTICDLSDN